MARKLLLSNPKNLVKLLFASLLLATSLPVAAEIDQITVKEYIPPTVEAEQIYLILLSRGRHDYGHSKFKMRDMNHCQEEGKRYLETGLLRMEAGKDFYCVKASE